MLVVGTSFPSQNKSESRHDCEAVSQPWQCSDWRDESQSPPGYFVRSDQPENCTPIDCEPGPGHCIQYTITRCPQYLGIKTISMAASNLQSSFSTNKTIHFMPFSAQKTVTFSPLDCAHISPRQRRSDFSSKKYRIAE